MFHLCSYHEHQNISFAICTALRHTTSYSSEQPLWYGCTMLSYRNMLFCTDSAERGIYPLRKILPGGKLSGQFHKIRYVNCCTLTHSVYQCLSMSVHEKVKTLQESLPPGKIFLKGYIPLSALSVQNSIFLYDSIVHPYHKGCSDQYKVLYSVVVSEYAV